MAGSPLPPTFLRLVPGRSACAPCAGELLDAPVIEEVFGARCARLNHTNGMFTLVPLRAALLAPTCAQDAAASLQELRRQYDAASASYRELGERFQRAMADRSSSGDGSGHPRRPQLQLLSGTCVGCAPFPRPECAQAAYDRSGRDGWPDAVGVGAGTGHGGEL